jgi:hypothetical protein
VVFALGAGQTGRRHALVGVRRAFHVWEKAGATQLAMRFRLFPELVLQHEDAGGPYFENLQDLRPGSESQCTAWDLVLMVQLEHEVTRPKYVYPGRSLPRPQVFEPRGISVVRNPEVGHDLRA